jgi:hypothetical protein
MARVHFAALTVCALVIGMASALTTSAAATPQAAAKSDHVRALKLTGISPNHSDISGRNEVALSGHFGTILHVNFGKARGHVLSYSGTGAVITVPPHRAGTVHVQVVSEDGVVKAVNRKATKFTYRNDGPAKFGRAMPSGTVGLHYYHVLRTTDDRPGTWTATGGQMPDGLASTGQAIEGVPTAAGASTFTLTFTGQDGRTAHGSATLHVAPQRWVQDSSSSGYAACADNTCYRAGSPTGDSGIGISSETDGGPWSTVSVAGPAEVGGYGGWRFTDFACGSPTTCAMIGIDGEDDDSGHDLAPFAIGLHDGHWTATQLGADTLSVGSVACTGEKCVGVGSTDGKPRLKIYTAGAWTTQRVSLRGTGLTALTLDQVTCATDGSCHATGPGKTSGGKRVHIVLAIGSNGRVGITRVPGVGSIACNSRSACVALASKSHRLYWVELRRGKWSAHRFVRPGRLTGPMHVSDLACNGVSVCFAVGWAREHGVKRALITRFAAGTAETFIPRIRYVDFPSSNLQAVTCVPTGDCYAGGYDGALVVARLTPASGPSTPLALQHFANENDPSHIESLGCEQRLCVTYFGAELPG